MTGPAPSGRSADDDLFLLLIAGALGFGAVAAAAATLWSRALSWLLFHHVLLPASGHPRLALPGCRGAGLDIPRLAVLTAAALIAAAIAGSAICRRRRAGALR